MSYEQLAHPGFSLPLNALGVSALLAGMTVCALKRRGDLAPLIGGGALLIAVIVCRMLWTEGQGKSPSVWPVILAGAAFLYLWWLAALIFDLVFAWHRYVRHGTMIDAMRKARAR